MLENPTPIKNEPLFVKFLIRFLGFDSHKSNLNLAKKSSVRNYLRMNEFARLTKQLHNRFVCSAW